VGEETFRIAQHWVDEVITVPNDAICAAVKEIFEDRRAVLEPAGALAYAGLRQTVEQHDWKGKRLVAIACGANLNFDRLRHIAERAQVGEHHEAILAITIPERPGAFRKLCSALGDRQVTEFNYRMGDRDVARVFAGVSIRNLADRDCLVHHLRDEGYETVDLSQNEIAKTHVRHMVGGRSSIACDERLFHFDFPERSGALATFLDALASQWNISLFHYRNHGSDRGRALVGIQVPPETQTGFETFLRTLPVDFQEETDNFATRLFL
jgi:threonine dehydratase